MTREAEAYLLADAFRESRRRAESLSEENDSAAIGRAVVAWAAAQKRQRRVATIAKRAEPADFMRIGLAYRLRSLARRSE